MVPYYFLLTVPILLYPFVKNKKINDARLDRLPLFLFFAFLTVMVMLRHRNVGNDTANYSNFYTRFSHMSWEQLGRNSMEIGYKLLNKALSLISEKPQFFLAVTGILTNTMFYVTYRKLCVDPPLVIVLFCTMTTFQMLFCGIRQMQHKRNGG
jgi:hypothetical protein